MRRVLAVVLSACLASCAHTTTKVTPPPTQSVVPAAVQAPDTTKTARKLDDVTTSVSDAKTSAKRTDDSLARAGVSTKDLQSIIAKATATATEDIKALLGQATVKIGELSTELDDAVARNTETVSALTMANLNAQQARVENEVLTKEVQAKAEREAKLDTIVTELNGKIKAADDIAKERDTANSNAAVWKSKYDGRDWYVKAFWGAVAILVVLVVIKAKPTIL